MNERPGSKHALEPHAETCGDERSRGDVELVAEVAHLIPPEAVEAVEGVAAAQFQGVGVGCSASTVGLSTEYWRCRAE